ncbi:hypothetical protein BD311DRAFT_74218 [Dichomitus squalens]|uniref:Uncharacterized protein n=1 Tax=Dichomitus squalens TaxID=114155 RepID=A0A4Q9MAI2_9APHY|nr:hypothetical protein BD311DRAFT_74218 [Dichomitus squalens]
MTTVNRFRPPASASSLPHLHLRMLLQVISQSSVVMFSWFLALISPWKLGHAALLSPVSSCACLLVDQARTNHSPRLLPHSVSVAILTSLQGLSDMR